MAALLNAVAGNVGSAVGISRTWSSGLCDCMGDTGSCCDVYFCTPCQVSRQCEAIDGRQNTMDTCLCCVALIMENYGNGGVGTLAMILRYRFIAKYNITGEGVIQTFFNSMCCPLCSMCQTHRELSNMMLWPGGTCCGLTPPGPLKGITMG